MQVVLEALRQLDRLLALVGLDQPDDAIIVIISSSSNGVHFAGDVWGIDTTLLPLGAVCTHRHAG
jgi:hypothetical protein